MNSISFVVFLASLAVNLTVGLGLIMQYLDRRRKRLLIEDYLRAETLNATCGRNGLHTLVHLVVKLGLPEDEILEASFRSKCVIRMAPADRDPVTKSDMLLGYQDPSGKYFARKDEQVQCG